MRKADRRWHRVTVPLTSEPIARFILVPLFYTRTPATDFAMIASDLEHMAQRLLEPGPRA
jgi:hypothetical protein